MPTLDAASHALAVWKETLEYISRLHSSWVRQWFGELTPIELAGGVFTVKAATKIQQQYLMGKCREVFNEAAQAVTGNLISVNFVTGANAGGGLARLGDAYDDVHEGHAAQRTRTVHAPIIAHYFTELTGSVSAKLPMTWSMSAGVVVPSTKAASDG